jgi:hypothetical protein
MIPLEFPRRFATLLLRFAIWIAPHDTRDWGRGMLGELNHAEGNGASLVWAQIQRVHPPSIKSALIVHEPKARRTSNFSLFTIHCLPQASNPL